MGKIKIHHIGFEFQDQKVNLSDEVALQLFGNTFFLTLEELHQRLMKEEWHTLETLPDQLDHYDVCNVDPKFGKKSAWTAYWDGKCFQDDHGGIYKITHWKRKYRDFNVKPPIPKFEIKPKHVPKQFSREKAHINGHHVLAMNTK